MLANRSWLLLHGESLPCFGERYQNDGVNFIKSIVASQVRHAGRHVRRYHSPHPLDCPPKLTPQNMRWLSENARTSQITFTSKVEKQVEERHVLLRSEEARLEEVEENRLG